MICQCQKVKDFAIWRSNIECVIDGVHPFFCLFAGTADRVMSRSVLQILSLWCTFYSHVFWSGVKSFFSVWFSLSLPCVDGRGTFTFKNFNNQLFVCCNVQTAKGERGGGKGTTINQIILVLCPPPPPPRPINQIILVPCWALDSEGGVHRFCDWKQTPSGFERDWLALNIDALILPVRESSDFRSFWQTGGASVVTELVEVFCTDGL